MNCSFKASSQALHLTHSCHVEVTNKLYCGSVLNYTHLCSIYQQACRNEKSQPGLKMPVSTSHPSIVYLLRILLLLADLQTLISGVSVSRFISTWALKLLLSLRTRHPCFTKSDSSALLCFSTLTSPWSKPKWINHYPLLPLSVPRCVRPAGNIITPDIVWIIGRYCKVVLWLAMTCCACCVYSTKVNIAVSHRINTDVSVCYHTCKSHPLHTKHKLLLAEWWYWSKTLYRLWMQLPRAWSPSAPCTSNHNQSMWRVLSHM